MIKTYTPKQSEIKTEWVYLNANSMVVGKLATEAAKILMGKHKANYSTHMNVGDKVVITNAKNVVLTGNKATEKEYIWHTHFPKGLRSVKAKVLLETKPEEVLKKAITGMLPKNKLRKIRMANLYIYAGDKHPHAGGTK